MRGVDILASFELEINKLNETLDKPVTDDSLYWINQAVVKFVKERFNGNAPKRTSYEQNEKRTRDLIRLLREVTIITDWSDDYLLEELVHDPYNSDFRDIDLDEYTQWYEVYEGDTSKEYVKMYDVYTEDSNNKTENIIQNTKPHMQQELSTRNPSYNSYEYKYPEDMMFMLNEDVIISNLKGEYPMNTCVFECTADSFMYRINNKLTDFHYRFHRARPLRIRTRDGFKLLTDKKYKIKAYTLGYLKVPTEITSEDPYKDYTDFDDHIWLEITKIAAQMFIENQSDPRYKTIVNEVLTQE